MRVGIVGLGVVGKAIQFGFKEIGHDVKFYDKKFHNSSIQDVIDTEICYICVPTPMESDGKCNTAIVRKVVGELASHHYKGIIAIKSTVEPGTTDSLQKLYQKCEICFVPEFLRERCAVTDFTDNQDLCVIGTHSDEVFRKVELSHGKYPNKVIKLLPIEAEFVKYFLNTYNATLIIFANSFYEVCKAMGVNYMNIKNAIVNKEHISDLYLDCSENLRGFGGACLPKDAHAMAHLVNTLRLNVDFFEVLIRENAKYKTTVFEGMRKKVDSEDSFDD